MSNRKIRIAAIGAALIGTIPIGVALAQPADAAVGCATRAEFRKVHVGQSVKTTQHIIGGKGRQTIGGSFLSQRQWKVCGSPFSWVTLTYVNGRLDNKIML